MLLRLSLLWVLLWLDDNGLTKILPSYIDGTWTIVSLQVKVFWGTWTNQWHRSVIDVIIIIIINVYLFCFLWIFISRRISHWSEFIVVVTFSLDWDILRWTGGLERGLNLPIVVSSVGLVHCRWPPDKFITPCVIKGTMGYYFNVAPILIGFFFCSINMPKCICFLLTDGTVHITFIPHL